MKKIQKNLRGSFNVFSNSARQLEVPLNKRNREFWENQVFWVLLLWHLVAEGKSDAIFFIASFPLYMYFFKNIDAK